MTSAIVRRNLMIIYGLDLVFAALVPFAEFAMLGVPFTKTTVAIYLAFTAAKWLLGMTFFWWVSAPIRTWLDTPAHARSLELIERADRATQRIPTTFALFYAFTWSITFVAMTVTYVGLDLCALGARALDTTAFMVVAVSGGSAAFSLPVMRLSFTKVAAAQGLEQAQRGVAWRRPRTKLASNIAFVAICLAISPLAWGAAIVYTSAVAKEIVRLDYQATVALYDTAAKLASEGESALKQGRVVLLTPDGRTVGPPTLLPSGDVKRAIAAENGRTHLTAERALHTLRTPLGQLATIRDSAEADVSDAMLAIALLLLIVLFWAPICAALVAASVTRPIDEIERTVAKLVEDGRLAEIGTLPVARNDEVGQLTARFNALLDLLRALSASATAVAEGRLTARPEGNGDLPDAFRSMISSLDMMVRRISQTSVQLASTASEIFAASQEQEESATSQSAAIIEISRTMESLAGAAAHVSTSVKGVLSNAERTLDTTDQMVGRISELNGHAHRIGEILEVIRDISDRSDLLALNGSLEASRAGEAGRGFSVVATEMRRLAERVTASVGTVKGLVSDIRASGSSTVMATEESKKLASETTDAARQISRVIQQQLSGTEQVTASVKDVAEVLTLVAAATTQTRASAEDLKRQAETLAQLVSRFSLSEAEAHAAVSRA